MPARDLDPGNAQTPPSGDESRDQEGPGASTDKDESKESVLSPLAQLCAAIDVVCPGLLPSLPLNAATVPTSVFREVADSDGRGSMALPDYLFVRLCKHFEKCKTASCNHLSRPLSQYRRYTKWREFPKKQRDDAVGDVTSAIWDAAPCDFITQEKKRILDIEKELIAVLEDGGLDDPGRLEKFFDKQSDYKIIGVLWAGDFQFPDAQSLFRLTLGRGRSLAGFADAVIEAEQTPTARPPKSVVSQNKKLNKQLASKKAKCDTLAQQNKDLKTKVTQLKQGAAEGEKERKKLKTEHASEKTQWTLGDADRKSEIREKTGLLEKQTKQTRKERQRRKELEEDNTQLAAARDRAYEQLKEKNAKLLEHSVELEEAQGACVDDFAVPGGACFDFGSMMLRRHRKSAFEGSEVRCGDAPKR